MLLFGLENVDYCLNTSKQRKGFNTADYSCTINQTRIIKQSLSILWGMSGVDKAQTRFLPVTDAAFSALLFLWNLRNQPGQESVGASGLYKNPAGTG